MWMEHYTNPCEFYGDGISYLTMDDRFAMTNMAIEAGAKNGIFPVDELAIEYMKEHSTKEYKVDMQMQMHSMMKPMSFIWMN